MTPDAEKLPAAMLSGAPAREFVTLVGPLFEDAPGFLYRLAAARPFDSTERLIERAREIAHAMPEALQVELVDAHPRLGAAATGMSAMSRDEQTAGDRTPSSEEDRVTAELDRLNREYESRFGFRYCVFVAGRTRSALLPEMAAALGRDRESELQRAIDAVVDIAADRQRRTA